MGARLAWPDGATRDRVENAAPGGVTAAGLPAAAVVLLSYPLHPPGKPERLRIEHFPALAVPSLFVNGDRDPVSYTHLTLPTKA